MTEILLKGRKTLTHPSIHYLLMIARHQSLHRILATVAQNLTILNKIKRVQKTKFRLFHLQ